MTDPFDFEHLVRVAAQPPGVRVDLAAKGDADRYRYAFYNWRRHNEDLVRRLRVSFFQRGASCFFVRRQDAHHWPELASAATQVVQVHLPNLSPEESSLLFGDKE